MTFLEQLGIAGGDFLRDALTNCSDPLAAIEEFQNDNGILLPSLRPALPFIDLHGIHRVDFHSSVLEDVRDNLIQRITNLANGEDPQKLSKLEGLLEKSFPVVRVKTLQPVVMCILKHIPEIKDEYLVQIVDDRKLYAVAATEVKRQIWQNNQALFGDEVSPLLTQYISEREALLFSCESSSLTFFTPSPRSRRQGEVLQKLVHMIGKNIKLYDMVLQFLRTLFLRTRNVHYCTLRAELLMALHDLEIQEICSADPCHKFTWCVDACVRERFVDAKRSKELQGFLDGIRKGQEFVLGDLSMILCDPYAANTVMMSLMRGLQHCVNSDILPRENNELQLLVRMISLSLGAWDMIDSQVFKEPKMESHIFTRFLPIIVSMMVDDQLRSGAIRISEDPSSFFQHPNDIYKLFVKMSPLSCLVAMYYTLSASKQKDKIAVSEVLPTLVHSENDRAYEDTFLHSLVSLLICMGEYFSQEEFCIVVFDEFLLAGISRENVLCHVMRLLWFLHPHIPPGRLQYLLEKVSPTNEHTETTRETFRKLMDKISTYQPDTPEEQPHLDSPLMSVPIPSSPI